MSGRRPDAETIGAGVPAQAGPVGAPGLATEAGELAARTPSAGWGTVSDDRAAPADGTTPGAPGYPPRLPSLAVQARAALVVLVGMAALVALASQLLGGWERSAQTLAGADRGWLALSFALTVCYMAAGGIAWWLVLRTLGGALPLAEGVRIFFISSLVRYLPGRIWYTVTRVYMCDQVGVPTAVASVSLVVEILLVLASGALVSALALPLILADYGPPALMLGAATLIGGLVALHPRILLPAMVLFSRLIRRPLHGVPPLRYRSVLGLVLVYIVCWLFASAGMWALLRALTPLDAETLPTVAAAYAVSFLLGFVNPVMPAGLGVREGALALLLGWVVPLPLAAALAVLFRVWVTLGEAVLVAIVAILQYRRLRRASGTPAASPTGQGAGLPVHAAAPASLTPSRAAIACRSADAAAPGPAVRDEPRREEAVG